MKQKDRRNQKVPPVPDGLFSQPSDMNSSKRMPHNYSQNYRILQLKFCHYDLICFSRIFLGNTVKTD